MSSPPNKNAVPSPSSSPTASPARRASSGGSHRRSSSRNKDSKPTAAASDSKTSPPSGHQRKSSTRGSGRPSSQGAVGAGGPKKDGATTPPSAQGAHSEGLANLKNIISELKDAPTASSSSPTGTTIASSSVQPSSSSSPARKTSQHRKNGSSSSAVPAINLPPPPPPSALSASSTLNPNAGGFQPGSLSSISDMIDEGLITPTASRFDLMTGLPLNTNTGSTTNPNLNVHQSNRFRQLAQPAPQNFQAGEVPEDVPGFGGGVAGVNSQAFSFPANTQTGHNMFLQQLQQQQNFQLQQMANMGFIQQNISGGASGVPGGPVAGAGSGAGGQQTTAEDLLAEQLAIQQQLESLRIQQESLLARFGDMQAASGTSEAASLPPTASSLSGPPGHRRIQSHQVGGVMGSFATGQPFVQSGTYGASTLPKGHGRRHSVNVPNKSSFGSPNMSTSASPPLTQASFSPAMSQNMSPPLGSYPTFGGGGGFTFPNNGQSHARGQDDYGSHSGGSGYKHHRTQSGSVGSFGGFSINNHNNSQANLAEAQQHLQSLAAFRASAGHARIPSFGMSLGGSGPGQLAMAGYGGGIPQQVNGQPQRKSLFAPYLPQASIPPLVAAGKLVIGVLRVNKRNRSDAYVATDVLDADIYICGSKDRNRALEGDVVAVELLDVDEVWGTKKEKEEKKRKKEENGAYDPRATRETKRQDKKKDDVEVEGQGLLLFEEEEVNDEQKPQFAGHVVAVVERAPGQLFSGMLGVLRPSSAATQQKQDAERREREGVDLRSNQAPQPPPKIIWFRPTDKRVPLIAIPTEQAPPDFVEKPDKYANRLFVSCIKRWPISSLHPFGTLVEELGSIGDIETETNALLKDCSFSAEEFSENVAKCLPPTPWTIPERELNKEIRRDYRDHRVFTIDPETAKDLDDALHVVENDDGTFEVGVHIADVTHFVKPNTALDREARKRATSVYLTQRVVPMLPSTLSEELCSLVPGTDRLTFSVVFTLSPDARVLSTWFGKTIIKSKGKLSYDDAQGTIEGRSIPEGKVDAEVRSEVERDIQTLATIARQLRQRRFENGALRIERVKVSVRLDENGLPDDSQGYERKEANDLIEEFMLLANTSVAGKIASGLPEQALLRRHEPPLERRLDGFVDRMKRLGISIDGSSSGALMRSLDAVSDPNARLTVQHLSAKMMTSAKYFCTGMLDISKYHHYALNVPLYAHFTSPIRRYADIMTHRQLEAVLMSSVDVKFNMDTEAVSKVAQMCNMKKGAARLAQEQSTHLYLCHLISDLTARYGPVVRQATVIGVLDEAFDVLVTDFGIEKRVHINDLPIENAVWDEHTNSLALYWKKNQNVLRWLAENQEDEHLQRVRQQGVQASTGRAEVEGSLFDDDDDDSDEDEKEEGEISENGNGQGGPKRRKAPTKPSVQHAKSQSKEPLRFERTDVTAAGHRLQTVEELQSVPVVICADLSKSPPVIKVVAVNPFE